MEKVVLYSGNNESGRFYQSEDSKTFCVVRSGVITYDGKLVGEAKFDGSAHENGINAGLVDSPISVVISYDKFWVDGKLLSGDEAAEIGEKAKANSMRYW